MNSYCTQGFWKMYHDLTPEVRRAAVKAYKLWLSDTTHPSLYFKPIPQIPGVWSARITKDYRAVCQKLPDGWLWYAIGDHQLFERLAHVGWATR